MLKHNERCCKKFSTISLSVHHNYFDLTKLFSDLTKFLDILTKPFFSCTIYNNPLLKNAARKKRYFYSHIFVLPYFAHQCIHVKHCNT